MIVAACASRGGEKSRPTPITIDAAATPADAAIDAAIDAVPAAALTPLPCDGADHRLYGSTCCEVVQFTQRERYPGKVYLRCEGPQIGQACTKKSDCDIACSCDADNPFHRRDRGPADGTRGLTGVCTGTRAIGVWLCDLDETGAVSHMIVD